MQLALPLFGGRLERFGQARLGQRADRETTDHVDAALQRRQHVRLDARMARAFDRAVDGRVAAASRLRDHPVAAPSLSCSHACVSARRHDHVR